MASFQLARRRTPRQLRLREQLEGKDFQAAIAFAVKNLFRFTHRASEGKALWSDFHVVWLGKSTFLTWCLEDSEFDIPFIVAKTRNAPRDKSKLREAVSSEVMVQFQAHLSELPREEDRQLVAIAVVPVSRFANAPKRSEP